MSSIILNQTRVRDLSGHIGTVVYQGSVAGKTREYLGVIWDDPLRGKHDGSLIVDGKLVRYFNAPTPTSASFCLPSKLDFGRSLTREVLLERYEIATSEAEVDTQIIAEVQTSRGFKPIELVGGNKIKKQQQLEQLAAKDLPLSLRRMGISSVAEGFHVDVAKVDLACNLLSDWAEVEKLLASPLQELSLAHNRLVSGAPLHGSYPLLRLNLCATHIDWNSVTTLAQTFPRLQELSLAHNHLHVTEADIEPFENLVLLDVANCHLHDLTVLASGFPRLETLIADNNPVENVGPWNVKHISLLHTNLSVQDLDFLNALPNFGSLRFKSGSMGEQEARGLIIARLPKLYKLNGTNVAPDERHQAEHNYVVSVRRELAHARTMKQDEDSVLSQHPQYQHLLKRYSDPTHCENNRWLLKDCIVNITLESQAAQSCTAAPLVRRVPTTLTIERLQALCMRQFGLDMDLQVLYLRQTPSSMPIVLEPDRTLQYYGVRDGAKIIMNEKELSHASDILVAVEERIEQQENEMEQFQRRRELMLGQRLQAMSVNSETKT